MKFTIEKIMIFAEKGVLNCSLYMFILKVLWGSKLEKAWIAMYSIKIS